MAFFSLTHVVFAYSFETIEKKAVSERKKKKKKKTERNGQILGFLAVNSIADSGRGSSAVPPGGNNEFRLLAPRYSSKSTAASYKCVQTTRWV